jgi:arylformamidase
VPIYRDLDQAALDAQYNLRQAVPAHPAYFTRWAAASRTVRASTRCRLDIAYGDEASATLDLFLADDVPGPVVVFLHGGFWQSMDKSDFSFIAPAYLSAGISVAIVNYALAPAAAMDAIVAQIRRAVVFLARQGRALGIAADRLLLAGHSAGGHLATMAMLSDWRDLGLDRDPVSGGCAVSGVFDLEPIRLCYHNRVLGLDAASARRNSPALLLTEAPAPRGALILAVGGRETAEFRRQQAEFAAASRDRGWKLAIVAPDDDEHFSMMDRFAERSSPLATALIDAITRST